MDGVDSYTCTCVAGYTGDTCTTGKYLALRGEVKVGLSMRLTF